MTCVYLEPFNFLSVSAMMIAAMDALEHLDRNAVILSFILWRRSVSYTSSRPCFSPCRLASILDGCIVGALHSAKIMPADDSGLPEECCRR